MDGAEREEEYPCGSLSEWVVILPFQRRVPRVAAAMYPLVAARCVLSWRPLPP